ncbi:unnamed protein product [Sphenostylis stenocarpa]|uniref:Uncharacterized protein n=1 Tax=Sphenostylis stenocarpa TaxID=92480 RepID=A0AA86S932_9FABA|nr:unnamed protein product [Sphenostylis stenocarpa]
MRCLYKGTMVLSKRTKNNVKIPSSCSLFDYGAAGCTAMRLIVREGWRVVVLAACLGAVRVKPCEDPDPLVNDPYKLPHASDQTQKPHTLFSLLLSLFNSRMGMKESEKGVL